MPSPPLKETASSSGLPQKGMSSDKSSLAAAGPNSAAASGRDVENYELD